MDTGINVDWIESGTISPQDGLMSDPGASIKESDVQSWISELPDFDVSDARIHGPEPGYTDSSPDTRIRARIRD